MTIPPPPVTFFFALTILVTTIATTRIRKQQQQRGKPTRKSSPATVYLVGAGPGSADLITVRGLKLLQTASIVLNDRLVPRELLTVAENHGAMIVNVGKDSTKDRFSQSDVEHELIQHAYNAGEGKIVVRLKGGDPFMFGLGGSEVLALREAGIPCVVVPGLTSAISIPTLVNVPLTHKNVSAGCIVLSAHADPSSAPEWCELPQVSIPATTLVVLMCAKNIHAVARFLLHHKTWSFDLPVALIYSGSTPDEQRLFTTLGNLSSEVTRLGFETPPLLLCIGRSCDVLLAATSTTTEHLVPSSTTWQSSRPPLSLLPQQQQQPTWFVFGYGSLIWKATFPFAESWDANIDSGEWIRRFYQGSPDHRGTPDKPGRVVTLLRTTATEDWTARVWGKLFRIVGQQDIHTAREHLVVREQAGYDEVVVPVVTADSQHYMATVFIATPENPHYLGSASIQEIAQHILTCHGPSGSNKEYFWNLYHALSEMQQRVMAHAHVFPTVIDTHLYDINKEISRMQISTCE